MNYLLWQNICWDIDLTTRPIEGKNKGFQALGNLYESCSFSFFVVDSATFSVFKICGGGSGIRKGHGQNKAKKLRKLEKRDCRLRKAQIDLEFWVSCSNNSVVPNFSNFRVTIKPLKSSRTYQQCQWNLLHKEFWQKKYIIRVLLKEFEFLHSLLQAEITFADFTHAGSLLLGHNEKL